MKRWQKVLGAIIMLLILGCAAADSSEDLIRSKQTVTYPQHGSFERNLNE